jgi:hypothetical protein
MKSWFLGLSLIVYQVTAFRFLIVPGLGGSVLYNRGKQVWPVKPCDITFRPDHLRVDIDSPPPACETVGTVGTIQSIEIDSRITMAFTGTSYYSRLVSHLQRGGHSVGALPYDFRYIHDPRHHLPLYEAYKRCIEIDGNKDKATLICHSTGGLVVQHFLHTFVSPEWTEKHIAKVYYLDVPFEGCPAALHLLMDLTNTLTKPTNQLSLFRLLDLIPNVHLAGGLYLTLPSGQDPVMKSGGRWYYPDDIGGLLTLDRSALGVFEQAQDFIRCRGLSLAHVPQVVCFSIGLSSPVFHDYDCHATLTADGDGLVPLRSLCAAKSWEHAPSLVQMRGLEHSRMNSHLPILQMIARHHDVALSSTP